MLYGAYGPLKTITRVLQLPDVRHLAASLALPNKKAVAWAIRSQSYSGWAMRDLNPRHLRCKRSALAN
jgi:hypothetical protein